MNKKANAIAKCWQIINEEIEFSSIPKAKRHWFARETNDLRKLDVMYGFLLGMVCKNYADHDIRLAVENLRSIISGNDVPNAIDYVLKEVV